MKQIYNNTLIGLESELPDIYAEGTFFICKDSKKIFIYNQSKAPELYLDSNTADQASTALQPGDNNSELVNDSEYTSIDETGRKLVSKPAESKVCLLDANDVLLSEISVAFLNNEGTTIVFNETDETIELQDDEGNVLSSFAVSDLLTNVPTNINLTGSTLELRDVSNTVLSSVNLTIANIQGLQAELNNKISYGEKGILDDDMLTDSNINGNQNTTVDLNTLKNGGWFRQRLANNPNSPYADGIVFYLFVISYGGGSNTTQITYPYFTSTANIYIRNTINGNWQPWEKIPYQSDIEASLNKADNSIQKSGEISQTIEGDLILEGSNRKMILQGSEVNQIQEYRIREAEGEQSGAFFRYDGTQNIIELGSTFNGIDTVNFSINRATNRVDFKGQLTGNRFSTNGGDGTNLIDDNGDLVPKIDFTKAFKVEGEEEIDVNTIFNEGLYEKLIKNTSPNIPTNQRGYILVFKFNDDRVTQLWMPYNNDDGTYIRYSVSGIFSNWKKFAMVDEIQNQLNKADNAVQKEGVTEQIIDSALTTKAIFPRPHLAEVPGGDGSVFTDVYAGSQRGITLQSIASGNGYPVIHGQLLRVAASINNDASDRIMELYASRDTDQWFIRRIKQNSSTGFKEIYHEGNLASSPQGVKADNSVQKTGEGQQNIDGVVVFEGQTINRSVGKHDYGIEFSKGTNKIQWYKNAGDSPVIVRDVTAGQTIMTIIKELVDVNTTLKANKLQTTGGTALQVVTGNGDLKTRNRLDEYTVATLPTGTTGDKAYVTDALAPAYRTPVVGGGTEVAEVFFNGTNWIT